MGVAHSGLLRLRRGNQGHSVERGVPPTPRGAAPITLGGDNQSMTLADAQQHRLLELLRKAGNPADRLCRAARRRD
jgi:hypothetical protein